jgi:hypothetical protein
VHAPRSVWRAMLSAPVFVLRRLGVISGAVGARGPAEWERTAREPVVTGANSTESDSSVLVSATTEMTAARR